MIAKALRSPGAPTALGILVAVQLACAVFFVNDVVADYFEGGSGGLGLHLTVELIATLALVAGIAVEIALIRNLLDRKARLEHGLRLANAEVHKVIRLQFEEWRLSPAETDIAMFLVKGLGTQEIASLRGSADGTVKAHLASIFRKSDTHSRTELLSVIIDKLLGERLHEDDAAPTAKRPAQGREAF